MPIHPRRQRLVEVLAEVPARVSASLDWDKTLAAVAELAVRSLADFCLIDIVEEGGIKRVTVAHADPDRSDITKRLLRYSPAMGSLHPSAQAIATGKPVFIDEVTEEVLSRIANDPVHGDILAALGPESIMAIPLAARDRLLGAVLFVSSSGRYIEEDCSLAERLVSAAALEVDNARLFRETRHALLARDRMLGIVAHDLRNPLNVIAMSAELLLDTAIPEEARSKQIEVILRSTRRMNRLIQDLLDVARIEADRLSLTKEPMDPARLAREAVEFASGLAALKGVSITFAPNATLPPVLADHDRMLQVLANVLDNAIKFAPNDGEVSVSVEPCAAGGVCFTVRDDGPGIATDELPELFRPFWKSRAGSLEGAGLGLMIAQGIIDGHGGRIWAESELGEGSTFHFTLPPMPADDGGGDDGDGRRRGPRDRRAGPRERRTDNPKSD